MCMMLLLKRAVCVVMGGEGRGVARVSCNHVVGEQPEGMVRAAG